MPRKTISDEKVAIVVITKGRRIEIERSPQEDAIKQANDHANHQEGHVIFVEKILGGLWISPERRTEIDIVLDGPAAARRRAFQLAAACKGRVETMEHVRNVPLTKTEIAKLRKTWPFTEFSKENNELALRIMPGHEVLERITICEWTDKTHAEHLRIGSEMAKERRDLENRRAAVAASNALHQLPPRR